MVAAVSGTTEAFARVKINALRIDAGWDLTNGVSALFEHALPDNTQADYVLCDRQGRPMAALEAKRASTDPITAQDQGRHYAEQPDAVHDTLRGVGMTGVVDADAAQLGPLANPKPEGVEPRRREHLPENLRISVAPRQRCENRHRFRPEPQGARAGL